MDFKKLLYFMTVAEEGQITRAAKRLHMAQPPLTHQIKVFENELGVQLIEKVGRQIRLTKIGCVLRDRAEQIMNLVDLTEKELKDLNDGMHGTLSIGNVASWSSTLLPERMRIFNQKYPAVTFQFWEGTIQRITSLLDRGVIEIGIVPFGIVPFPIDPAIYESFALPAEPVVAAIHSSMADLYPSETLSMADIADKPLILHRRNNLLSRFFKSHDLNPKILCIHDDVRSMLTLAGYGLGIAIVPRSATSCIHNANLVYRVIDNPNISITTNIIWMKNRYLTSIARNFLDMLPKKSTRRKQDNCQ